MGPRGVAGVVALRDRPERLRDLGPGEQTWLERGGGHGSGRGK